MTLVYKIERWIQMSKKQKEMVSPSKFDFNTYVNSYIDMVRGIFVNPIDTIKQYTKLENYSLGIFAIILNCIVSGIFLFCFCSEAVGTFTNLVGGYSSYFIPSTVIEVPFMKIFLCGFLFVGVGLTVTALMIYVIANAIFKDSIDMKKSFILIGVCSAFTTITTIISIILTYISMKLMIIVLLFAGIFYLTYLYQGISEITKVDKNKLAYVFVPAIGVASFVVIYILPKILF